jgi:hypothetical protein
MLLGEATSLRARPASQPQLHSASSIPPRADSWLTSILYRGLRLVLTGWVLLCGAAVVTVDIQLHLEDAPSAAAECSSFSGANTHHLIGLVQRRHRLHRLSESFYVPVQLSQLLPLQLWDPQYGAVRFLPKHFHTQVLCKVFTVVALGVCQPYMLFLAAFMCSYGIKCVPAPRLSVSHHSKLMVLSA